MHIKYIINRQQDAEMQVFARLNCIDKPIKTSIEYFVLKIVSFLKCKVKEQILLKQYKTDPLKEDNITHRFGYCSRLFA